MTTLEELNEKYYGLRNYNNMTKYQTFIDEDNERLLMGPFVVEKGKYLSPLLDTMISLQDKLRKLGVGRILPKMSKVENDGDLVAYLNVYDFTKGRPFDSTHYDGRCTYIAEMHNVKRLHEVCGSYSWIYDRDHIVPLIKTLSLMWVLEISLEIADVYVLTDTKEFFILDIYNTIKKERDNQYFFFRDDPSYKCGFYEQSRKYYPTVAQELSNLKENELIRKNVRLLSRLNKAIDLLKEYGKKN